MSLQAMEKKLFVLFTDNPNIGLTGEPSAQVVALRTLRLRPGYLLEDIREIDKLGLDEVWHDRVKPDGVKIWRVK